MEEILYASGGNMPDANVTEEVYNGLFARMARLRQQGGVRAFFISIPMIALLSLIALPLYFQLSASGQLPKPQPRVKVPRAPRPKTAPWNSFRFGLRCTSVFFFVIGIVWIIAALLH
jgi:hypothetical protein